MEIRAKEMGMIYPDEVRHCPITREEGRKMIRRLYTSAMGMILQEKRQSNISNNLSNIETNAFKSKKLSLGHLTE